MNASQNASVLVKDLRNFRNYMVKGTFNVRIWVFTLNMLDN